MEVNIDDAKKRPLPRNATVWAPVISVVMSLADAAVIDRVVAAVGEEVITESDVRLESALGGLDDSESPFWDSHRTDSLSRLIDAAVVRQLAGKVALYQPSDDEVRIRLESMRGRFADREDWTAFLLRHGLDEESLRGVLRRRIVAERYLARNVVVRATDDEAWWAACQVFLAEQRLRYRIRLIPEMASTE